MILVQPFVGVNGLEVCPPVSRTGNKHRLRKPIRGILGYHPRDVVLSGRQQEWLTVSRPAKTLPARQMGLFGW